MYGVHIQTSLSIRGHIVFIEYFVTEEWAVEWWLTPGYYDDNISDEATPGAELLETLLRTYESQTISQKLISEFENRQYHEEQRLAALCENEDIPF